MKTKKFLIIALSLIIAMSTVITNAFAFEVKVKDDTQPHIAIKIDEQNNTVTLSTVNFPEDIWGMQFTVRYAGSEILSLEECELPDDTWAFSHGKEISEHFVCIFDCLFVEPLGDQDVLVINFKNVSDLEYFYVNDGKIVNGDFEGIYLSPSGYPEYIEDTIIDKSNNSNNNEEPKDYNTDFDYNLTDGDLVFDGDLIDYCTDTEVEAESVTEDVENTDTETATTVTATTTTTANPTTKDVNTGAGSFGAIFVACSLAGIIAGKKRK